jgi:hypothetical protein
MKRLLLAATLGLTSVSANAVCPSSIVGKYVGHGQYTEQQFINKVPIISYIESHIMSISITATHIVAVKTFYAATGNGRIALPDVTGATLYIFDKTTCMGQMGGNADPLYFVVSDSGNTINFIHGKPPVSTDLSMETWELNKQ